MELTIKTSISYKFSLSETAHKQTQKQQNPEKSSSQRPKENERNGKIRQKKAAKNRMREKK